jgi:hypothetical protein
MLTANEAIEIFYLSDEFSKEFDITFKNMFYKKIMAESIGISLTG